MDTSRGSLIVRCIRQCHVNTDLCSEECESVDEAYLTEDGDVFTIEDDDVGEGHERVVLIS